MTSRVRRELRPFVSLAIVVIAYGILRLVFAHLAGSRGVMTPSASADTHLVVLGIVVLAMRVAVLVGVPFVAVYRVVQRLFALARARRGA